MMVYSYQQMGITVTGEAGLAFINQFPAMGQTVTVSALNRLWRVLTPVTVCTAQCTMVGVGMEEIFNDSIMTRFAE